MSNDAPLHQSALAQGLTGCHVCGLVCRLPTTKGVESFCPRCGGVLHSRKPDSLSRTWAYLIAACVLYIPANVLPIMVTTWVGSAQKDTILSGIIYLWEGGSYPLAIVIFIASFMVPLSKLIALFVLVICAQRRSHWRPTQRAKLYRMVEFIGKWSMLDVYVASLLTTLVSFGALMNVKIGFGAIAFGAVVVLTMMAAKSFDPRLTWDSLNLERTSENDRNEC